MVLAPSIFLFPSSNVKSASQWGSQSDLGSTYGIEKPQQVVLVHTYNSSTWGMGAGRSRVRGQPEVHSQTLSLT
jgi:hypothetical protein